VLANANDALVFIIVEGKVDEGFAEQVSNWSNGTVNARAQAISIIRSFLFNGMLLNANSTNLKDNPEQTPPQTSINRDPDAVKTLPQHNRSMKPPSPHYPLHPYP
jgi:hypothetical protein